MKRIDRGTSEPKKVIEETATRLFDESELSPSAVVAHTLSCLSYLVAADRLQLRFVFMPAGVPQKEVVAAMWRRLARCPWIWERHHTRVTAQWRQVTIDKAWCDGNAAATRVERLVKQWERQWNNEHSHSLSLTTLQALPFVGPTASERPQRFRTSGTRGGVTTTPVWNQSSRRTWMRRGQIHRLRIPDWLNWKTGRFSHQSRAVEALRSHESSGILAIATGGGKTRHRARRRNVRTERSPRLCPRRRCRSVQTSNAAMGRRRA